MPKSKKRAGGDGPEIKDHDWLVLRVPLPGTARRQEAAAAYALLLELGCVLPVPRPAVGMWTPEDMARLHRNMRLLGIDEEDIALDTDLRNLTDVPADEIWRKITTMDARLKRTEAGVARLLDEVQERGMPW